MSDKINTKHEIVGKKLSELPRGLDIGTYYPVIDESQTIIGVYSATDGSPDGYDLDEDLQAYTQLKTVGEVLEERGLALKYEAAPGDLDQLCYGVAEEATGYQIWTASGGHSYIRAILADND